MAKMGHSSEKQEERLAKAAESYAEMEKMIKPFIGKRYKRLEVSDKWSHGDRRLVRTARAN